MKSAEIRRQFLDYFAEQGHRVVRSSSLIPQRDPTLLFTNAGMNQFKDLFLGREKRDYSRAATAQKCVRAGGKHNDLENVGYTRRHLTFFEMLGNFSFGDYFKRDAIRFAWELVTRRLAVPADQLHVTVFREDDEAWALWRDEVGLPETRISRLDEKDNFWAMGDTGPCGPCSEIYIDTGAAAGCRRAGCAPGCDCDRFLEFWNLVFMQYERDAEGRLQPLPRPAVDTGMGLERMSMILQGVGSVYETDLLRPIIDATAARSGTRYGEDEGRDVALRVIADHLRSSTFLLADGALPANEGRGYVLRRIIRRALRFGKRLGFERPFLHELCAVVVDELGVAYPELGEGREHIARVVRTEEERFAQTLAYSGRAFDDLAQELERRGDKQVPGDQAFRLYDTFGLPLDTLKDMAEVRGLGVDEEGFRARMEEARTAARATWKGGSEKGAPEVLQQLRGRGPVEFIGHDRMVLAGARVLAVLSGNAEVALLKEGDRGEVVLGQTPFYPEGGGQVGDRGVLVASGLWAQVEDTVQPIPGLIVHRVSVRQGVIRPGDELEARVERSRRRSTALNHSATHLLHAALRSVLGEHVKQAGSRVEPERLRFDFTHYGKLEPDDLRRVEELVNREISDNDTVESEVVPIDEALRRGAIAFFGDKYGDRVRVVRMGDFSMELCGGTHAPATGSIGYFQIASEGGVSAGVRRIEARTGDAAVLDSLERRDTIDRLAAELHVPPQALIEHVQQLAGDLRSARKELAELRLRMAAGRDGGASGSGADGMREVGPARVAVRRVEGLDAGGLRQLADELRRRVKSGVVVLGSVQDGQATLLVSVTEDLADRIDAGSMVRELAPLVGGRGGGRKDMAQGGGPDGTKLDQALEASVAIVARRLGVQS